MALRSPSPAQLRAAPKVVLHDHLDGGLRPTTVLELANEVGHPLPTDDPDELAAWFRLGADRGDLVLYLEGFDHTIAVMQTTDALHRVAREFVEDLAADGVVHAEVRWAPENHTAASLTLDDAIEAVTAGLAEGSRDTGTSVGQLVTIMRQANRGVPVAEAAVRWRDRTAGRPGEVVGMDLAGPEAGHPADLHVAGFDIAHRAGLPITVHAGEAHGVESIRRALDPCGAQRIGHGVRIVDDFARHPDGRVELGPTARAVRDRGIPLELCPTSNVHTGAVGAFIDHPLPRLRDLGFTVTLNPDDKLMSGITVTSEYEAAVHEWGWGVDDLEQVAVTAAEAAFLPATARRRLVDDVLRPGWASLREELQ